MSADDGTVSVLLVEDDEDDFVIIREMLLGQDRSRFALEWCDDYGSALKKMRSGRHDAYLVDYRLGQQTGLDLVREAFRSSAHSPVILLTGVSDTSIDLEASASGITDFMLKQELSPYNLERTLRYAIAQHQATERLAESEERFALAVRAANDGIWDWDLRSDQVYYAPRWLALLGLDAAADDGRTSTWFDRVHPDDIRGLRLAIDAHLSRRTSLLQSKHRVRHSDGSWRWMLARAIAVDGDDGEPLRMAGSLSDITPSRVAEHRLRHDALHDPLTGLPNRAMFLERLERAVLARHSRPDHTCAVLFIDVDRFKLVNDTYSHSVGDLLLVAMASRLARGLGPTEMVARLAGDEFTILLEHVPSSEAEAVAVDLAVRVSRALEEPFVIDGHRLVVTGSTGIALGLDARSATDLMRNADIAMYEAKYRGRDRYTVFDTAMHHRIVRRLELEHDLRQAVDSDLIEVHYQPIVELATGALAGFEALARWPQGMGERVPPCEFVPVAEETGMISQLGLQVLARSLADLAQWRRSGLAGADVSMSVNVSGRQLDEPDFPDLVLQTVKRTGLPGAVLHLEITEGVLMREPERMASVVSELSACGIGLDLDDFGTGYSSLAALHRFPVSVLKIDQSFVSALTGEADGDAIVRSTVALGHGLRLKVTAEGIETDDQLGHLRRLGCDHGQGYLFSPPVPAERVPDLIRNWEDHRAAIPC
jgi:diguanylate cyclase (GGDEF)-like protein/PAS domain S-box-containing protein